MISGISMLYFPCIFTSKIGEDSIFLFFGRSQNFSSLFDLSMTDPTVQDNPDKALKPFDCITAVNGQSGNIKVRWGSGRLFGYHGPPKPTCLEVFLVNNPVFKWPKPLIIVHGFGGSW